MENKPMPVVVSVCMLCLCLVIFNCVTEIGLGFYMLARFNQIHSEFVKKIDFRREFYNQAEIWEKTQHQFSRNKRDEPIVLDAQSICENVKIHCPRNPGIVGPVGPPGQKGESGLPGPHGIPGIRGPIGYQGYPGLKGKKGETGEKDEVDSSFDITTKSVCPKGDPGEKGYPGLRGYPGHPCKC